MLLYRILRIVKSWKYCARMKLSGIGNSQFREKWLGSGVRPQASKRRWRCTHLHTCLRVGLATRTQYCAIFSLFYHSQYFKYFGFFIKKTKINWKIEFMFFFYCLNSPPNLFLGFFRGFFLFKFVKLEIEKKTRKKPKFKLENKLDFPDFRFLVFLYPI